MKFIYIPNLLSAFLSKLLPDRTKRLVLLSSLYALLCGTTSFSTDTINKLNKIMNLSSQDKALEFPMQLSSVIWRSYEGKAIIYPQSNTQSINDIVNSIMEKIPKCLLYSDKQNIFSDIAKLLKESTGSMIPN